MAKTNWQDPGTSEIRSTHISGLMDAVGKLEESIGMNTIAEENIPLAEVYISENDRYRIFQAPAGKRNWLSSPAPVIKKNGVVITEGFIIDYGGGAIALAVNDTEENVYTADVTYVTQLNTSFKSHLEDYLKHKRIVEDFGAVGNANYYNEADGNYYEDAAFTTLAHDDYEAIQAAIDSLISPLLVIPGGSVFFGEKGYWCSKPLRIPNRVTLIGAGRASTRIIRKGHLPSDVKTYNGQDVDAVIHIVGADGMTAAQSAYSVGVMDMSLIGAERDVDNMTNYGIYMQGMSRSFIKNVYIEYINTGIFSQSYIWDSEIKLVQSNICQIGFRISSSTSLNFASCYVNSYRDYGYYCNSWLYSHMSNCAADAGGNRTYFSDTTIMATAYYLSNCKGVKLTACGSEGTNGTPLHVRNCENIVVESSEHRGIFSDYNGSTEGVIVCAYRISEGKNIELRNNRFAYDETPYKGAGSANSSHYRRFVNSITEGLVLINNDIIGNPWQDSGATGISIKLSGMWLLGNVTGSNATIYVNYTSGNDLTGNGASDNPYKTINRALADLPRVIDHSIIIQLQDADYVANVNITGFLGKGTVTIQGNASTPVSTRIKGNTVINNNVCTVILSKLGAYAAANSAKAVSIIDNPGIVEIKDCIVSSWSSAYTSTIAIHASRSPFVLSTNNTGVDAKVGLQAELGSTIIKNGTQPTGTTSNEVVNTGGLIR